MSIRRLLLQVLASVLIASTVFGCSRVPEEERPAPIEPTLINLEPTTGGISGKVLDAEGKPLADVLAGDQGIMALYCPSEDMGIECLHEGYGDIPLFDLFASIFEPGFRSGSCLLYWGQSAARIGIDGSYSLEGIPPGKYELVLFINSSGVVLTVHILKVNPVQAGETTVYDLVTQ
jgi:hypothetical protein